MKTRVIALVICIASLWLPLTGCVPFQPPPEPVQEPLPAAVEAPLMFVDLQGHPLCIRELPTAPQALAECQAQARRIARNHAKRGLGGSVSYVGRIELPPGQMNDSVQVAVITDRYVHQRAERQPDTGLLSATISDRRETPWRLEANKIGFTPITLDLPTENMTGKIVWIGSHTMVPSPAQDATIIHGTVVDAAKKQLKVSGTARLYLSGTGGEAEHYATDITDGKFRFEGVSPDDYHFIITVPGYNTFNQCIDTRRENGSVNKRIRAYPRMELRLHEIDGDTQTVQMGTSQNDRSPFRLQDRAELLVAQYGHRIIFRSSHGGATTVAHCPGPIDSPDRILSRVLGREKWYGQWAGDVAPGDLIVLLKNDAVHSIVEVEDIHPIPIP